MLSSYFQGLNLRLPLSGSKEWNLQDLTCSCVTHFYFCHIQRPPMESAILKVICPHEDFIFIYLNSFYIHHKKLIMTEVDKQVLICSLNTGYHHSVVLKIGRHLVGYR